MERAKLGRAIERLLRCTEVVACPVDASTIDSERGKAIGAYGKAFAGFEKDRERHTHLTQSKKLAALAKDWLDAYQDVQVFDRLRALLAVMQDRTEAVVRSTDSPVRTWVPVPQDSGACSVTTERQRHACCKAMGKQVFTTHTL